MKKFFWIKQSEQFKRVIGIRSSYSGKATGLTINAISLLSLQWSLLRAFSKVKSAELNLCVINWSHLDDVEKKNSMNFDEDSWILSDSNWPKNEYNFQNNRFFALTTQPTSWSKKIHNPASHTIENREIRNLKFFSSISVTKQWPQENLMRAQLIQRNWTILFIRIDAASIIFHFLWWMQRCKSKIFDLKEYPSHGRSHLHNDAIKFWHLYAFARGMSAVHT